MDITDFMNAWFASAAGEQAMKNIRRKEYMSALTNELRKLTPQKWQFSREIYDKSFRVSYIANDDSERFGKKDNKSEAFISVDFSDYGQVAQISPSISDLGLLTTEELKQFNMLLLQLKQVVDLIKKRFQGEKLEISE